MKCWVIALAGRVARPISGPESPEQTGGLAKKLEITAKSTEPSANPREKGEAVEADGTATTVPPSKWGYRAFWPVDQRRRNIASIRSVTRKPPTTL
jgi:hypothetical protein